MCCWQVDGSNCHEAGDNENPMLADSESDHSSAAQEKHVKRSKDRASESRDSSLARSTRAVKPVAETKAVEGRKRLRRLPSFHANAQSTIHAD